MAQLPPPVCPAQPLSKLKPTAHHHESVLCFHAALAWACFRLQEKDHPVRAGRGWGREGGGGGEKNKVHQEEGRGGGVALIDRVSTIVSLFGEGHEIPCWT